MYCTISTHNYINITSINIARHKTYSLLRFLHQQHLILHRENVGMAVLILSTLLLCLAGANANAAGTVKPHHKIIIYFGAL